MKARWRANWLQSVASCAILVAAALAFPNVGFANGKTISPTATLAVPYQTSPSPTPPPLVEASELGYSVATANTANGIVVVVGDPQADVNLSQTSAGSVSNAGAAFVFVEPTGGWSSTTSPSVMTLTASTPVSGSGFGTSVAISNDGNTIVVGAPGTSSTAGAAYVFANPGGAQGWGQGGASAPEKTLTDGTTDDMFGISVGVSNSTNPTVVVGAEDHTIGSYTNAGAAYVFYFSSNSGWVQDTNPLTASDAYTGYLFGGSVAIGGGGKTILVGSSGWNNQGANTGEGAAYVFTGATSTWSQATEISDPAGFADDAFGTSVAISGASTSATGVATAVVGAPGTASTPGAAYVFTPSTTGSWSTPTAASLATGTNGDFLGQSVAISSDASVIAVGAPDAPSTSSPTPALYEFDAPSHGKNPGSWSGHIRSFTYEISNTGTTNFGDAAAVGIDSSGTAWVFGGADGISFSAFNSIALATFQTNGEAFVFTQ